MDFFLLNSQALKAHFGDEVLSRVKMERVSSLQVLRSRSGLPTAATQEGFFLHSRYDPQQEATRFISGIDIKRSVIVVFGFGFGYHIREVLKRVREGAKVFIFESRPSVLKIAMKTLDLREIFSSPRVRLCVGQDVNDFIRDIPKEIDYFQFDGVSFVRHPSSCRFDPDFYNRIEGEIVESIQLRLTNLLTQFHFQGVWIQNLLQNACEIISNPGVATLFTKFTGIPAFIIGAGPSLEKNVRYLACAKGKGLLICTDTALKPILKWGIVPDFVVTLDAQEKSCGDFDGLEIEGPWLVADATCTPKVLSGYKGGKLIFFTGHAHFERDGRMVLKGLNPLMDWFYNLIPDKGHIQTGGSVSTSSFDLARCFGADPIVFVGQDLSYSDERLYADGVDHIKRYNYMREYMTDYIEKGLDALNRFYTLEGRYEEALQDGTLYKEFMKRKLLLEVPSYDGEGRVLTTRIFYTYIKWFEDAISKIDALCINATEGGAKISGAINMPLRDVVKRYCKGKVSVAKTLRGIRPEPYNRSKIVEEFHQVVHELKDLGDLCGNAEKYIIEHPNDLRGIKELDGKIQEGRRRIRFVDSAIQRTIFSLLRKEPEDLRDEERKLRILYKGIASGSDWIRGLMEDAIDRIMELDGSQAF
jgi:hypothetical protein